MARFTVASVPYVNAAPLVWWFEHLGEDSPVRVVYDVPSRLPALLESGEAQAILVSSVDALRSPGRHVLAAPAIASRGPVQSVRLFSKVPFAEIQTLAWDASSMTSNRLSAVLLLELFGIDPKVTEMKPALGPMLATCDACVLIGDIGMSTDGSGLHVLDLGTAWTAVTGLPFVWAVWAGDSSLAGELGRLLMEAWKQSGCGATEPATEMTAQAVAWAASRAGWSVELADNYLNQTMDFWSVGFLESSLRAFQQRLLHAGFDDCGHFPRLESPVTASV